MTAESLPLLAAMLLAGLTGSLHCAAMCGPLHVALHAPQQGRPGIAGFAALHAGRLWTYGLLGLLAGTFSDVLRLAVPGQRVVTLLLGVALLLHGGRMLRPRASRFERAATARLAAATRWLLPRPEAGGLPARLLLGAALGLLPCGMLWAMLLPAAALPSPPLAAMAMILFGLGTIPVLTAAVGLAGFGAPLLTRYGRPAVAWLLILAGAWMIGRVAIGNPGGGHADHARHAHHVQAN